MDSHMGFAQHLDVKVERPIGGPGNKADFGGQFKIEHIRDGRVINSFECPNGIVDVGLNHILETQFHSGTAITAWAIGLIDNSGYSALAAADTMSSHTGWGEATQYTEANRPAWTAGTAASRAITNAATVDYSMNATKTIKGIFVAGGTGYNTKSATTGTLWATAAFGSTVSVVNGDTLRVTYTVSG